MKEHFWRFSHHWKQHFHGAELWRTSYRHCPTSKATPALFSSPGAPMDEKFEEKQNKFQKSRVYFHFGDKAPASKKKKIIFLSKGHLVNFQQDLNKERDGAQLDPATSQETSGTNTLLPNTLVCCKLGLQRWSLLLESSNPREHRSSWSWLQKATHYWPNPFATKALGFFCWFQRQQSPAPSSENLTYH